MFVLYSCTVVIIMYWSLTQGQFCYLYWYKFLLDLLYDRALTWCTPVSGMWHEIFYPQLNNHVYEDIYNLCTGLDSSGGHHENADCLTGRVKTLGRDGNDALFWHINSVMLGTIETDGVIFSYITLHNLHPTSEHIRGSIINADQAVWSRVIRYEEVCMCVRGRWWTVCNVTSLCHLHCYSRPCLAKGTDMSHSHAFPAGVWKLLRLHAAWRPWIRQTLRIFIASSMTTFQSSHISR